MLTDSEKLLLERLTDKIEQMERDGLTNTELYHTLCDEWQDLSNEIVLCEILDD